jgi:hypothetical protein
MLKRNGQLCEHAVPDYSGRLTDAEFAAYNSVFTAVESDFKEFSSITSSLGQMEQTVPRLLEGTTSPAEASQRTVEGQDGSKWNVVAPLLQMRRGEIVWCQRNVAGNSEFAVVERFDPDSALAKAQGPCEFQMKGNNARALLQDFIEGQRGALQMYASDIVAAAQERADEKYPGQDLSRVIDALSQRCTKQISVEQMESPAQARKQTEGIRV